jgi:hypothetical protein
MTRRIKLLMFLVLAVGLLVPTLVQAGPVITGAFNANTLPGNDDGSTGLENIGFSANFFGTTYTQLYVNNNGNVTFNGPLGTYTPFGLTTDIGTPIIAAFFADVDTRVGNVVTYGQGTVGTRSAFGVNYLEVGYFGQHTDKLNTFQLVLIDRADVGVGDFDIMFNYDQIQWETGDASNGSGGLGGYSARAGYSNGTGVAGSFYEMTGSGVNGAFLDGGVNALISYKTANSDMLGRYIFEVRNGNIEPPVVVPIPPALVLMGSGLLGLAGLGYRRKRS